MDPLLPDPAGIARWDPGQGLVEQGLQLRQVAAGGERELVGESDVLQHAESLHPGGIHDPGEARQVHDRGRGAAGEQEPQRGGVVRREDQLESGMPRAEIFLHGVAAPHRHQRIAHVRDPRRSPVIPPDHEHGRRFEVGAGEGEDGLPLRRPHERREHVELTPASLPEERREIPARRHLEAQARARLQELEVVHRDPRRHTVWTDERERRVAGLEPDPHDLPISERRLRRGGPERKEQDRDDDGPDGPCDDTGSHPERA